MVIYPQIEIKARLLHFWSGWVGGYKVVFHFAKK
jgi:hypothetical protein